MMMRITDADIAEALHGPTAPPLELSEAYMRAAIATRPEETLSERITAAGYLDAIAIQERGLMGLDDERRGWRIVAWNRLKRSMLADEAALRFELGEGS